MEEGAYGLGSGEDGGEADGLLEEHVVSALHLLRGAEASGRIGGICLGFCLSRSRV
jgi:hypothetical protein